MVSKEIPENSAAVLSFHCPSMLPELPKYTIVFLPTNRAEGLS